MSGITWVLGFTDSLHSDVHRQFIVKRLKWTLDHLPSNYCKSSFTSYIPSPRPVSPPPYDGCVTDCKCPWRRGNDLSPPPPSHTILLQHIIKGLTCTLSRLWPCGWLAFFPLALS